MSSADDAARGSGADDPRRHRRLRCRAADRPRVDMDVSAGRVVAVVGPNGAGKSTLLKAILGVARVDAGRVELGGAT